MLKNYDEDVYRLLVCQWAYGWSDRRTFKEIKKFYTNQSLENFIKSHIDKYAITKCYVDDFEVDFPKEYKNRTYGNKYIKRKYR